MHQSCARRRHQRIRQLAQHQRPRGSRAAVQSPLHQPQSHTQQLLQKQPRAQPHVARHQPAVGQQPRLAASLASLATHAHAGGCRGSSSAPPCRQGMEAATDRRPRGMDIWQARVFAVTAFVRLLGHVTCMCIAVHCMHRRLARWAGVRLCSAAAISLVAIVSLHDNCSQRPGAPPNCQQLKCSRPEALRAQRAPPTLGTAGRRLPAPSRLPQLLRGYRSLRRRRGCLSCRHKGK